MKKSQNNIIRRSFVVFLSLISVITLVITMILTAQTLQTYKISTTLQQRGLLWHKSYLLDQAFSREMLVAVDLIGSFDPEMRKQKSGTYIQLSQSNDVLLRQMFESIWANIGYKEASGSVLKHSQSILQDLNTVRSLVLSPDMTVDIFTVTENYGKLAQEFESVREYILEPASPEQFALSQYLSYGSSVFRFRDLFYEESALLQYVRSGAMELDERLNARFSLLRQAMEGIQNKLKLLTQQTEEAQSSYISYSDDYLQRLNDLDESLAMFAEMRKSIYASVLLGGDFMITSEELDEGSRRVLDHIDALQKMIIDPAVLAMNKKVRYDLTLLIGVGVIALLSFVIFFFIYQVQQTRVLGPLEELTGNMLELADGNLTVALPPPRRDELGRVIEALHVFRDNSRDLQTLNSSINAMLESLGQGLLFFDSKGICSSTHSTACLEVLGSNPSQRYLPDVLKLSQDASKTFSSWLQIVFAGQSAMGFDDLKGLLPRELVNEKGLIIELDYKPMYDANNALFGVLLIATDVTYKKKVEEQIAQTQQEAKKIKQVAQNRNGFFAFITDFSNFIDDLRDKLSERQDDRQCIENTLRALHTFKGIAASFDLNKFSEAIHQIENDVKNKAEACDYKRMVIDLEALTALLDEPKEIGQTLFGADFLSRAQVKNIEVSQIQELAKMVSEEVRDEGAKKTLHKAINAFLQMSIQEMFYPFVREISRLAEQQGKPIPDFDFAGENLQVIPDYYEEFFGVLIHVARNIVDHGLEVAKQRENMGKPPQGTVGIDIGKEGKMLTIVISDDGAGIDVEKLRKKLPPEQANASDEEVMQHIFAAGVSSRETASLTSGRGIGLNALYEVVHEMEGEVRVTSDFVNHAGTTFWIKIPYKSA